MGSCGRRPGFPWREGRSVRGMQGHQFPAEPVLRLGRPAMFGAQERSVCKGPRDAPGVSTDGGPMPGERLELVRPRGELSARAPRRSSDRAFGQRGGQAAAAQRRQPWHSRGRARRSRPARARECRPALDAAGDGRPLRGSGTASSGAQPCPRQQGRSAPPRSGISRTAPEPRLPRSRLRRAAPGVASSVSIRPSQPSSVLHAPARARSSGHAPRA